MLPGLAWFVVAIAVLAAVGIAIHLYLATTGSGSAPVAPASPGKAAKGWEYLKSTPSYLWKGAGWFIAAVAALVVIGVAFIILCGIVALGATVADEVIWADAKTTTVPPAPGVAEVAPQIKAAFLRTPLDHPQQKWHREPVELNAATFDASRDHSEVLMNTSFMAYRQIKVISGEYSYAIAEYRDGPEYGWQTLRPHVRSRLPANASTLEVQRHDQFYHYVRSDQPRLGLHIQLTPPDDAVVMSTRTNIGDGNVASWGPVFTQLGNQPLQWECRVMFFDKDGRHRPETDFDRFPPAVIFARDHSLRNVASSEKTACYSWKVSFDSSSPQVADGKLLAIEIPPGFGESMVWVSFKVTLAPAPTVP